MLWLFKKTNLTFFYNQTDFFSKINECVCHGMFWTENYSSSELSAGNSDGG